MLLITMKRGDEVAGVDKHEKATYENFLAHGWKEVTEEEAAKPVQAEVEDKTEEPSDNVEKPATVTTSKGRRAK